MCPTSAWRAGWTALAGQKCGGLWRPRKDVGSDVTVTSQVLVSSMSMQPRARLLWFHFLVVDGDNSIVHRGVCVLSGESSVAGIVFMVAVTAPDHMPAAVLTHTDFSVFG